ncbi:TPA: DUF1133 family protein, partial [Klebsiella variicola subsp. variicola]|nr:DUF1133 family protein [Klebsiella variicola subsp. variicola]HBT3950535.1 DUF1133 family protein [Klebsiella variicola]HBQ8903022.1 DUF1133 family protein [Klebsiella variicola subsp. variicola]HBQ8914407.1 DUF1133 family protein [Klebsiella variicola subsp. variicola]HBQ8925497.1 DUF1133 family protein [Klebsiella variicola subsp. variicola]
LEAFFKEILSGKNKSGLAFCTDEEGLKIDSVLSAELVRSGNKALYKLIKDRYVYRMSKKAMAKELNEKHPDWCFMTCRRRVDAWISLAESMLYAPMCDAFGTNGDRFYLQSEPETA